MYNGDRSRKETLVEYGFRLPSALDNRPLKFEEWEQLAPQMIFVSATPGRLRGHALRAGGRAGGAPDRAGRSRGRGAPGAARRWMTCCPRSTSAWQLGERVLITTLTKRMAEDLTDYLQRARRAGALPARRHRDGRAHRDHPRSAPGQVRRAGRHQPAARGPRHARGVAGGDPRCRQGRVPALGQLADPDHRPRRAQHQRPRDPLRRPHDRLDAAGDRGDRPPARASRSSTTTSTASPRAASRRR